MRFISPVRALFLGIAVILGTSSGFLVRVARSFEHCSCLGWSIGSEQLETCESIEFGGGNCTASLTACVDCEYAFTVTFTSTCGIGENPKAPTGYCFPTIRQDDCIGTETNTISRSVKAQCGSVHGTVYRAFIKHYDGTASYKEVNVKCGHCQ